MNEKSVRIRGIYREKIRIKHLAMDPLLQGSSASFRFEGHDVEITLPQFPQEGKQKTHDNYLEAEADAWDRNGHILNVYIYAICVTIHGLRFRVPRAVAKQTSINATLFSDVETNRIDKRSDSLYHLARRAVDYWLRVVRWKTGLGLIDLDNRPEGATLSGGRLYNRAHRGAFYSPRIGRTIVAPKVHRLSAISWHGIVTSLAAGTSPPIWNEYLMSAHRRIEIGDLKAGTIDLAIAAESAIRQYPAAAKRIRKRCRISELLTNWINFGFPAVSHLPYFAQVKTLVSVRNKIMHSGDEARVNRNFCKSSATAVEHLVTALT